MLRFTLLVCVVVAAPVLSDVVHTRGKEMIDVGNVTTEPLLYLHIQKTGGTFCDCFLRVRCPAWELIYDIGIAIYGKVSTSYLKREVSKRGGAAAPEPTCRAPIANPRRPWGDHKLEALSTYPEVVGKSVCYHHPIKYAADARLTVAIFRDPRSRVISSFNYYVHGPGLKYEPHINKPGRVAINGSRLVGSVRDALAASDEPLVTYYWMIKGCQTRMLLGAACYDSLARFDAATGRVYSPKEPSDVELETAAASTARAVARVRSLAFVGLTERMDDSISLLYHALGDGLAPPRAALSSSTQGKPEKIRRASKSRPALLERQRALLAPYSDEADEAVYATAKALFEERFAAMAVHGRTAGRDAAATPLGEHGERRAHLMLATVCMLLGYFYF